MIDEAAGDQARPPRDGSLRLPLRRGFAGEEGRCGRPPALGVGLRVQPQVGLELPAPSHLLPAARGSSRHHALLGDHVPGSERVLQGTLLLRALVL